MIRRLPRVLAICGVFALVGATAAQAATRLTATVGPGNTISLKTSSGSAVRSLKPGNYTIVVRDRSKQRNFHFIGPSNVLNRSTSVKFVGTQTWRMRLTKGTYRYVCDPQARSMKGTFTVR